jgi:hypothetical protein
VLGHAAHGGEDGAMRVAKKIFSINGADDAVEGVVVDQDGAEDGTLGIGTLRHLPVE